MDKKQEERLLNKIKQNYQKDKTDYDDILLGDLLDAVPNLKAFFDSIEQITLPLEKIQKTYSFLKTVQALDNVSKPIRTIFSSEIFNTIELIQKQHTHVFMDLYKIDIHITNLRKASTTITNEEINLILQTLDKKDRIIITQQNEINQLKEEVVSIKSREEYTKLEQERQTNLSENEIFKLVIQQNNYLINEIKELRSEIETLKQPNIISLPNKTTKQTISKKHKLVFEKEKNIYRIKLDNQYLNNLPTPVELTLLNIIKSTPTKITRQAKETTKKYFLALISEDIFLKKQRNQPYRINEDIITIRVL